MIDNNTIEFIKEHRSDDIRSLALQAKRYNGIDMSKALCQIEGWQLAQQKLPSWAATDGIIYPVRISMEQCSSEATSQYKASLMQGEEFADLTGGFGIDCSYISKQFTHATYIERNTDLCDIAKHNFALLKLDNIQVVNSNSEEALASLPFCNWIFIDPARRSNTGGKVVALSDCEPDITELEERIFDRCNRIMVKCSPMLDITAACRQLKSVAQVHVVAVNNECKELLLILDKREKEQEPMLHCINITKDGNQNFTSPLNFNGSIQYARQLEEYLYEPNAAIQKAGCHTALSQSTKVEKLHPNSNLYTSAEFIKDFPGRVFRIEEWATFSKNEIKELLKRIEKANITVRNFPDTVQVLRKRLKIAEGGNIYLFATTLANEKKVLVKCSKIMQ